jgi:ATP-dependent Lon protease
VSRITIEKLESKDPYPIAQYTQIPQITEKSDEITARARRLTAQFRKAVDLGKGVDFLVFMRLMSGVDPNELVDQIITSLDTSTEKKQQILETTDLKTRLEKVDDLLAKEIKILEIEQSIVSKTQKKFDKSMRETVLRERLQTIKKELGESEEEEKDVLDLRKKIKKAGMPTQVYTKAIKELQRLEAMNPYNPEAGYIRTYLEWLTDMPWSNHSDKNISIKKAIGILETDHYGLKEVKERILEYLAVMQLKKRNKKPSQSTGTILCFVGPPGVGKTSMGKSIAHALERKFAKVSLGGIRDEAEIRGHRRTYVGAMPGRIIQGIKNSDTKNPVFMLDEIDKVGTDFRGDPSAALLEALDPEQNREFSDHYLEVPFDLSEVMFITTANVLDTIPPALLDRLEIINFSGYTHEEKFQKISA